MFPPCDRRPHWRLPRWTEEALFEKTLFCPTKQPVTEQNKPFPPQNLTHNLVDEERSFDRHFPKHLQSQWACTQEPLHIFTFEGGAFARAQGARLSVGAPVSFGSQVCKQRASRSSKKKNSCLSLGRPAAYRTLLSWSPRTGVFPLVVFTSLHND